MRPKAVYLFDKASGSAAVNTLADRLRLPVITSMEQARGGLVLISDDKGLMLYDQGKPRCKPFLVTFSSKRRLYAADALRRAMGKPGQCVVDATAGWCRDAWQMARQGFFVKAIERSDIVMALLLDAMRRCQETDIVTRLQLVHADSCEWLIQQRSPVDVVYLDPMFPEKRKSSAAVKKEMQLLQQLAHNDNSEKTLFEHALAVANNRVVVKRPHYAPPLASGVCGSTSSKLLRFDIYKPR